MPEKIPTQEELNEEVPSESEVRRQIDVLLDTRPVSKEKKIEDEVGLCTWDVQTVDTDGEPLEISYQRGMVFENGVVTHSRITQTLFSQGVPCGAGTQYDFVEGEWVAR